MQAARALLAAVLLTAAAASSATSARPGPAAAGAGALYYKLEGDEPQSKDWPHKWLKYSVLVVNPGLKPAVLAGMRRDLPGRKLVAYTCMGWA